LNSFECMTSLEFFTFSPSSGIRGFFMDSGSQGSRTGLISKKHYCTSYAALAFDGLSRLLFASSATVLASGAGLQYFKRIAMPTICLQIKFLRKPGQVYFDCFQLKSFSINVSLS